MKKHCAENERIKRRYFAFLKEAKRHSEPTVDAAAKALSRFETYTRYRDFKAFHFEQAIAFKKHLAEQKGQKSGEKLSKATPHWSSAQVAQLEAGRRRADRCPRLSKLFNSGPLADGLSMAYN